MTKSLSCHFSRFTVRRTSSYPPAKWRTAARPEGRCISVPCDHDLSNYSLAGSARCQFVADCGRQIPSFGHSRLVASIRSACGIRFLLLCSIEYVGALIERPAHKCLRIRIGFRRIRNTIPRGRSMIAPTFSIVTYSTNTNLLRRKNLPPVWAAGSCYLS